jgi:hypothetical protein
MKLQGIRGKWVGRFIWAAIVNGAFAVLWTLFMVWPFAKPAPSMVIASGSAGTWLLTGYVLFLSVGVVATAVTALFYLYIEGIRGKVYSGVRNYLAWGHLILMELGVLGSTWLLMYAGYVGGSALLPAAVGGGGLNPGQVHEQILQYYIQPIFYFVVTAILGALIGGLGYLLSERSRSADV